MFQIGQLVFVKTISDTKYLGIVTNNILYLNNFEEAFYEVYLIKTAERVSVPAHFIIPVNNSDAETGVREFLKNLSI
tara:strand:+ start:69 stop:299 length:231 start_codon:yes stop_codon:yes gene_type:complete